MIAGVEIPKTRAELDGLRPNQYLIGFLLSSDQSELIPDRICGTEISRVRFTDDDRPYVEKALASQPSQSWFDPGLYSLTVVVEADDKTSATRSAWLQARPAASFLGTYIRHPRQGLDLQRERLVEPNGWVFIFNNGRWELATYHTWLLMSIALAHEAGVSEKRFDHGLFQRLAEASNRFWSENARQEDRLRVERGTTWYGRSVSETDYASMLIKGWMAIVPLALERRDNSGLMLDRLVALAKRHELDIDRGFLEQLRSARNEIAHEASMANADPLAVDAAQLGPYLQPLRVLFIMSLLFVLEFEPLGRPVMEKWVDLGAYAPSIRVDESSLPVWHVVPEVFGHQE